VGVVFWVLLVAKLAMDEFCSSHQPKLIAIGDELIAKSRAVHVHVC